MLANYDDFLIKRFEQPDEVRTFEKGKFEIVKVGSMTIGRAEILRDAGGSRCRPRASIPSDALSNAI